MKPTTMSALLGRPLTPNESENFDLYLKIARQSLDELLCMDLCSQEDPRVYDARPGYRTVFTDIFVEVTEVKLNGDVVDAADYSVQQWDKRSASWYNSIIFDHTLCKDDEVEVEAVWGFNGKMPVDLQAVLAGLFDLVTKKNKFDGTVHSKRTEDFQITFETDADLDATFYSKYDRTINKYSLCTVSRVDHGKVC